MIKQWIRKYSKALTKQEKRFLRYHLRHNRSPLPTFYLTAKIHKTPWSTRPIVSCSGSLLYGIAVWVERQLQKIAQVQPSYIKNISDLKAILETLQLPRTAKLFTADARSMYTSIDTKVALKYIATYL